MILLSFILLGGFAVACRLLGIGSNGDVAGCYLWVMVTFDECDDNHQNFSNPGIFSESKDLFDSTMFSPGTTSSTI